MSLMLFISLQCTLLLDTFCVTSCRNGLVILSFNGGGLVPGATLTDMIMSGHKLPCMPDKIYGPSCGVTHITTITAAMTLKN